MPRPDRTAPQRSALVALRRLNPATSTATPEVRAHLEAIRPWLETWVLPHVAYAAGEPEDYPGLRQRLRDEAERRLAK